MTIPVLTKTTFTVSGIIAALSPSQRNNYRIIRSTWQMFNTTLKKLRLRQSTDWSKFGVTFRTNGILYYMAAIPDESHRLLKMFTIPGGQFALFEHTGPMHLVTGTIADIYRIHLPRNNLSHDQNRELIHYEHYDSRFHWNRPHSRFSILVPIRSPHS